MVAGIENTVESLVNLGLVDPFECPSSGRSSPDAFSVPVQDFGFAHEMARTAKPREAPRSR